MAQLQLGSVLKPEARDLGQSLRLAWSLGAIPQQGPYIYGWTVLLPGAMVSSRSMLLSRAMSRSMALYQSGSGLMYVAPDTSKHHEDTQGQIRHLNTRWWRDSHSCLMHFSEYRYLCFCCMYACKTHSQRRPNYRSLQRVLQSQKTSALIIFCLIILSYMSPDNFPASLPIFSRLFPSYYLSLGFKRHFISFNILLLLFKWKILSKQAA